MTVVATPPVTFAVTPELPSGLMLDKVRAAPRAVPRSLTSPLAPHSLTLLTCLHACWHSQMTGDITGTPNATHPVAHYQVTASNPYGSKATVVTISVVAPSMSSVACSPPTAPTHHLTHALCSTSIGPELPQYTAGAASVQGGVCIQHHTDHQGHHASRVHIDTGATSWPGAQ